MPLPHPTGPGVASSGSDENNNAAFGGSLEAAGSSSTTGRSTAACTIGLVADTHIPDRVRRLHPRLIPLLREAGVSYILHAGDISLRQVLDELQTVAPVLAVRGNRDLLSGPLPLSTVLEAGGARIKLVHGHFGLVPYLWDKIYFMLSGYDLKRYLPRLLREAQDADAIVFGHTHYAVIISQDGKLVVNPGSASFGNDHTDLPSFGLLRVSKDGKVSAEIVPLTGWKIRNREWTPTQ